MKSTQHERSDAWRAWLADAAAGVESAMLIEKRAPNFEEVLARARRLGDAERDVAPDRALESEPSLAEVISFAPRSPSPRSPRDTPLQTLIEDTRAHVEHEVQTRLAERARGSAPVTKAYETAANQPRRFTLIAGLFLGTAAAAAALFLAVKAPTFSDRVTRETAFQAVDADELPRIPETSPVRRPTRRVSHVKDREREDERVDAGPDAPSDEANETPAEVGSPAIADDDESRLSRRERQRRLATLDAEAQVCWFQGDLRCAEQRFGEIIRLGGRGERAQLAYGDLFLIAHQQQKRATEARLWRQYLRRFPNGRHADEARAGLCRRTKDVSRRRTCWSRYLNDFPRGSHRRTAAAGMLEE